MPHYRGSNPSCWSRFSHSLTFMPPLLKTNKNNFYSILRPLSEFESPSPNFKRNTCQKCRIAEEVIHRVGLGSFIWTSPWHLCLLCYKQTRTIFIYSEAPLQILERNTCQKCRIAEEVIHRVGLYINTSLAVIESNYSTNHV